MLEMLAEQSDNPLIGQVILADDHRKILYSV